MKIKAAATPAVLFLLLCINEMVTAVPVPRLNVPALVAASNLIVLGSVSAIHDDGATSIDFGGRSVLAQSFSCSVDVHDVLKGAIDTRRITIKYVQPKEPLGYAVITEGFQILLLRTGNSGYALADPYHPSLPAVERVIGTDGDVLTQLAKILGAVMQSSSAQFFQKQIALYALSTIRNPESSDLLRRELNQDDQTLRLSAAGFLLLRDDLAGMSTAEHAITHPESLEGPSLHNLDYALGEGIRDEKAVPALARIARRPELETRRAVASALRHTGSRSALEPLTALLNDPDLEVRHEVVLGLAQITGEPDWGPNLDLFRSDELKYLNHWQEWASSQHH